MLEKNIIIYVYRSYEASTLYPTNNNKYRFFGPLSLTWKKTVAALVMASPIATKRIGCL